MVREGQTADTYQEPFHNGQMETLLYCMVHTCTSFLVQLHALKLQYSLPHLEEHQVDPHPKLYSADELLSFAFK